MWYPRWPPSRLPMWLPAYTSELPIRAWWSHDPHMILYTCDPMDARMTMCDRMDLMSHPPLIIAWPHVTFIEFSSLFFSSLSPPTGLSPPCDLEALVTQNPKMSSLVISLIVTWLLISLVVVGVIGYYCARKHSKPGQVNGSQNRPGVVSDGCGSPDNDNNNKEPLMTEFCWQAKVLEGGLSDVMERRNSTLKRMLSPSGDEPWQCHVRRCSSVTYRALPPSPSPSSRDIPQNLNSSYGLAPLRRQENAYAELEEVHR